MLKAILINLLVWPILLQAGNCTYTQNVFASGEPYLKINIDTSVWLGITPNKFAEVLTTYNSKRILDSQVTLLKMRTNICDSNELVYESITELLEQNDTNLTTLVKEYKKFNDKTYDELLAAEKKKYTWGIVGFNIGFLICMPVIILLIIK